MRGPDLDLDGHEEIVIASHSLGVILAPACGGSLRELDYRPRCFNLSDVLTRREEAYHGKLAEAAVRQGSSDGAPASIHDQLRVKEQGLDQVLRYDRQRRANLFCLLLFSAGSLGGFSLVRHSKRGDYVGGCDPVRTGCPPLPRKAVTGPPPAPGSVVLD